MLPLQLPGGIEILVILLVFLLPVTFIAVVVGIVVYVLRRRDGRLDELESRVDALEAELESRQ